MNYLYLVVFGGIVLLFIAWATKVKINTYSDIHQDSIRQCIKQANDWKELSMKASKPIDAALAATRSISYLNAARLNVPDTNIEKITSVDISKLTHDIERLQVEKVRSFDPGAETSTSVNVIR